MNGVLLSVVAGCAAFYCPVGYGSAFGARLRDFVNGVPSQFILGTMSANAPFDFSRPRCHCCLPSRCSDGSTTLPHRLHWHYPSCTVPASSRQDKPQT